MKLWEKAILLGLVFTMLFTLTGFAAQCGQIENKVFRLHVLANSDSEEDQALKLKVRDRILEESRGLFEDSETREDAEQTAAVHLEEFRRAAQEEIYEQGYSYPVTVTLEHCYFNTRYYEDVTLPAGYYDALRVEIGAAEGKNWWCVMFPPMCLPAAEESKELSDVLDPGEMEIVEGGQKFEARFKIVEWIEGLKAWLRGE